MADPFDAVDAPLGQNRKESHPFIQIFSHQAYGFSVVKAAKMVPMPNPSRWPK